MSEASIPVDLLNPGQVFACLGLVEAADSLLGDGMGFFDWRERGRERFVLRANGDVSPVAEVLDFLGRATALSVAPSGSKNAGSWTAAWGPAPEPLPRAEGYPFPDPESAATLVCVLRVGDKDLRIEHWGDQTARDNVKFWAGSGGYPGAALTRDALVLIKRGDASVAENPFAFSAPQSSSFRFDWRRDYIPIDAGFSLNAHGNMTPAGYPLVELLAALGLSHARPERPERRNKLLYRYGVVGCDATSPGQWFRPSLLRLALGATSLPFPMRRFRMHLGWPGKVGQARSITTVVEEAVT